jgi:hypothetical protein
MVYFSMDQAPWSFFHLIVKSRMDLDTAVQSLWQISPTFAPYEIRSLETMVLDSTWRVRYSMMLLIALAAVALVGGARHLRRAAVYGRETRQRIGVRMPLGAERGSIARMVLREGLSLAAAGSVPGSQFAAVIRTPARGNASRLNGTGERAAS